ncbi:hypothetical protein [Streptomyces sp. WG-D5]
MTAIRSARSPRTSRLRAAAGLPAVAALLVGSVLLTGCGGGDSDADAKASPSAPADTATASAAPSESAEPAADAAGTDAEPVDVNKTIEDDVMVQKATVLKYVDGYEPSAAAKAKFSALEDEKVVLVQVKVTASSKYYSSFGSGSFRLTGMDNGIDQTSTTILDDEVKKAGYPPLEDARTGKTSTGWMIFTPPKETEKLVLRYKRLAAKASDGTDIKEKTYDVPLN